MNIREIADEVTLRCSIPQAPSYLSSIDITTRQILLAIVSAAQEMIRRAEWRKLYRELSIPNPGSGMTLPTDFNRLIQGSAVVQSGDRGGAIMPCRAADHWLLLGQAPSQQRYYMLEGNELKLRRPLTMGTLTIKYISDNWVNGAQSVLNSDTDIPVLPSPVLIKGAVWRFKRDKGLSYQDMEAEFEADLARAIAADRGIG